MEEVKHKTKQTKTQEKFGPFSLRAVMVPVQIVLMRLMLSFLVYKRVGYGLFSAICFAIVLLFYEHRSFVLALPIIKILLEDTLNTENNKYLTMFVHYYRYRARTTKLYTLTDTITSKKLAYEWPEN